jgi:hypothetical protein
MSNTQAKGKVTIAMRTGNSVRPTIDDEIAALKARIVKDKAAHFVEFRSRHGTNLRGLHPTRIVGLWENQDAASAAYGVYDSTIYDTDHEKIVRPVQRPVAGGALPAKKVANANLIRRADLAKVPKARSSGSKPKGK